MNQFHLTAKKLESEGAVAGFHEAVKFVGAEVAYAMTISHLRMLYGSRETYPPRPEIETLVNNFLATHLPHVHAILSKPVALFYTDRWYCFDNFSAFAVDWRGRLYPTVEHAYQAAKFMPENRDPGPIAGATHSIPEAIRTATSAHEAKKMGNAPIFANQKRKDWDDKIKLQVMEELHRAKAAQHEYVRRKIVESKGLILVEDSNVDHFWGRGPNWDGLNHQGKSWMKIRDES